MEFTVENKIHQAVHESMAIFTYIKVRMAQSRLSCSILFSLKMGIMAAFIGRKMGINV